MRIFKNRGAVYIQKSGYKSSKEEQILLSLLGVIVVFTFVFVLVLGNKYDYSVKNFFASEKVLQQQQQQVSTTNNLPVITGKSNYLLIETNNSKSTIFYALLIQADRDNIAYKVCTLSPSTKVGDSTINQLFADGGIQLLYAQLNKYFGFNIDYYAQFTNSTFKDFVGDLGTFLYPSTESFKFSGGTDNDTYSLRINEGEFSVNAKTLSNMLRYYSTDGENFAIPNELMLYALTGLVTEKNNAKAPQLFRTFIDCADTNITVRDYANATDALTVFTQSIDSIKVYSCVAQYDNNHQLTNNSLQDIRGYFTK